MKNKIEMNKRKEMDIVHDYNKNTWYKLNKNSRFIWKMELSDMMGEYPMMCWFYWYKRGHGTQSTVGDQLGRINVR
jgi:hypothetical protein